MEHPVQPPKQAESASMRSGLDLNDPGLHAALYEGRVPEEVSRSIDALISQAAGRRR